MFMQNGLQLGTAKPKLTVLMPTLHLLCNTKMDKGLFAIQNNNVIINPKIVKLVKNKWTTFSFFLSKHGGGGEEDEHSSVLIIVGPALKQSVLALMVQTVNHIVKTFIS